MTAMPHDLICLLGLLGLARLDFSKASAHQPRRCYGPPLLYVSSEHGVVVVVRSLKRAGGDHASPFGFATRSTAPIGIRRQAVGQPRLR